MGEETTVSKPEIKVIKEGKTLVRSTYLTTMDHEGQECTRIGDGLLLGTEIYDNIKAAINEMEKEMKEVAEVEVEEVNEEIKEAKAVVAQAEKRRYRKLNDSRRNKGLEKEIQ